MLVEIPRLPQNYLFVQQEFFGRQASLLMTGGSESEAHDRFGRLIVPYLADALSLAQWIAGRRSDAEDIVQDACLRAFRHQASLASDNPRAWLLAIVRNAAYAWLRRNRTPGVIFLDDLDAGERTLLETGDGADMAPTPEAELLRKADAQELERALEALPLHLRETVILRDVQGLSYREIAQVTEQPLGTVMSRLARGRRRLMQSLAGGKPDAA